MLVESNVIQPKSLPVAVVSSSEHEEQSNFNKQPTALSLPSRLVPLNSLSDPSNSYKEGIGTDTVPSESSLSSSESSSAWNAYSASNIPSSSRVPSVMNCSNDEKDGKLDSGIDDVRPPDSNDRDGCGKDSKGSCCYVADNMAGGNQRAEKYIVDIPYSVLFGIYQSLDADKGWEALAAETGYTFDKIKVLELEGARNQGSPSRTLLWELGSRNTTVRQLYGRLKNLSRFREMKLLEDYVHSSSRPSFEDNGLQGLPDVSLDMSNCVKAHKTSCKVLSGVKGRTSNRKRPTEEIRGARKSFKNMTSKNHESQNSFRGFASKSTMSNSMNNNSVNLNQPVACSDVNSFKCLQKDKHYTGKQMPTAASPSSSMASGRNDAPRNPNSLDVPELKPNNPGCRMVPPSQNVGIVRNMLQQMPCVAPSSNSSSSQAMSHLQTSSSSTSSSSPNSDSPFSSSLSSLPGLESTFDVQMAFMGSACFSYAEVVQATNGFSEQNKIGEGAFGTVYYGVLRKNKCAVKKMSEANGQETVVERSTQIKRELTSLLKFRHENIVTLYGYALDGESLCLVYQFMPNGSLEDRIMCKKNSQPLIWSQRLNIMLGACQGLNFLHTMGEQPLIHGDIKSANILLDKHMEAKIGDLGQAQQANGREGGSTTSRLTHITRAQATTKLYGTRAYQPREVQTGSRPSTKSDVFAMGVVLFEVFCGEQAYDERREGEHFLGDYFLSLKGESGDEACLSKIDRRGGECPQEVALAILNSAFSCTSTLKRRRPDSSQLLQKMTDAEELYREKTGLKHMGMESLPGSERSCHMSHSSSPGVSVENLAGAPPQDKHHAPHHSGTSQSNKNYTINMNKDVPTEKHYAMHLPHEKKHDCCQMASMNCTASSSQNSPQPSRQNSQSSMSSNRSPIDYFQKGQLLPPAFRLQQAYDCQRDAEKRRISRLSQCVETAQQQAGSRAKVLPQADPAKLAPLEQFDRLNLHGDAEEKESNAYLSDPKKLAALKNFDQQGHYSQASFANSGDQDVYQDGNLECDPKKLAYLRQFDNANVNTNDVNNEIQTQEEEVLASDPRKLEMLTQFDVGKESSAAAPTPTQGQNSCISSASPKAAMNSPSDGTFPVSQLDYVVTSQREALEACNSMAHQQPQISQQYNPAQVMEPQICPDSINERRLPANSMHRTAQNCEEKSAGNSNAADATLLLRRNHLFDLYSRAKEDEMDEDDYEDENYEYGNEEEETEEIGGSAANELVDGFAAEQCSCPVQEQVAPLPAVNTHYHPQPSEQDESVLNYFKQREQHYQKAFSKAQASHC